MSAMSAAKNLTTLCMLAAGGALILLGAAFSGADYARILLGADSAKDLSWGPALFRALLFFHGTLLIGAGLFRERFTKSEKSFDVPDAENVESAKQTPKNIFFGLIFLTILALVLRFLNLNSDLWVDEVYTLLGFVRQPIGEILTSFPSQNQHLLFSILAHSSIEAFGESAWALRLPSVLFGAASIWALFFLAKSLFGVRQAFLACVLMTVSYHHIWFSQNARGYMGLLFFTLLATWFWFEALKKNDWRWWFAYAAAVVFGMWIHMTMAFAVAVHGIVHLVLLSFPRLSADGRAFSLERRAGLRPFIAWLLSVTVTMQLYALALPEFLREGLHEESRNSEWTNPIWVVRESMQNLSIGFAGSAVVLCGAALVAFGCWRLWRENRRMTVWMILPPVLAGAFMLALGHNLFPRFFFFAMGFGLLIVVHGAAELPKYLADKFGVFKERGNWSAMTGVALVILMILASAVTVPRNYALPKQNFSGAKNYVESRRLPDERVIAVSIAGEMYGRYFAPQWSNAQTNEDLENAQRESGKIWLIYTLSPEIKAFHPQMWQTIQKDYEVVQVFPGTLNGGEIFVCQKRTIKENSNETSRNLGQKQDDPVR